jgi:glycosyltransferase involved in cell wall biosynthesis
MSKRITFLLDSEGHLPGGGKRVVYEYASRMAARGWKVSVIHPVVLSMPLTFTMRFFSFLRCIKWRFTKLYLPSAWFSMPASVRMVVVPYLSHHFIPNADYVVACPVQAAFWAKGYPVKKGEKVYFIQGFEDWELPREQVVATWKFPMKKIVVAKWLQEIAHNMGEKALYVPNGVDSGFFKVTKPFIARNPKSILFVHHQIALKGVEFFLNALIELKRRHPDLTVHSFAPYPRPDSLPGFVSYTCDPSQSSLRDLYNENALFIAPSLSEGWGLPPCEAMLCGCAVIASDIGGHREFVEDGRNAIFCKPACADSIVEKVEFLFQHPEIANAIANYAPRSLMKFDWNSRVNLFEKALCSDSV